MKSKLKIKEVEWFVRKYIQNEKGLELFCGKTCPDDVRLIMKNFLNKKGFIFSWEE